MNRQLEMDLDRLELQVSSATFDPRSDRSMSGAEWLVSAITARSEALAASVEKTVSTSGTRSPGATTSVLEDVVHLFLQWMVGGSIVRVVGAGRARLAASVPANRLAHGGARVYVQNDIIPMPHTVQGGGIIAASASGETQSVLEMLATVRADAPHITVVGIASARATRFRELSHFFIGIEEDASRDVELRALADIGEHVIGQVLDALVVSAGKLGGFDDRKWRLGHENLGDTGPYDAATRAVNLLFHEIP